MRMTAGLIPVDGSASAPRMRHGRLFCSSRLEKKLMTKEGMRPACGYSGSCLAREKNGEGRACMMRMPAAEPARK